MSFITAEIKEHLLECARKGGAPEMERLLQEFHTPNLVFDCWQASVEANNQHMSSYLFKHGLRNRCLMAGSKESILKVTSLLLAQKPPLNLQPWAVRAPHADWNMDAGRRETEQEAYDRFLNTMDNETEVKHWYLIGMLAQYGMQRLSEDGRFLQMVAYYKEPSKKQIKVAATADRPYLDGSRMEQHWPGITALVQTFEMLDLSPDIQKRKLHAFLKSSSCGHCSDTIA